MLTVLSASTRLLALGATVAVTAAACGESADDAPRASVRAFLAAVEDGDPGRACRLLAPGTLGDRRQCVERLGRRRAALAPRLEGLRRAARDAPQVRIDTATAVLGTERDWLLVWRGGRWLIAAVPVL